LTHLGVPGGIQTADGGVLSPGGSRLDLDLDLAEELHQILLSGFRDAAKRSRAMFREQRHIHVAVGTKARGKGRAHQTGRDQPLVGSKDNRDVADGVLGKWHERVGHYGQSQEIQSTGMFSATS